MSRWNEEPGATSLYEIRVRGHLPNDWNVWFGSTAINNLATGEALLVCPVADQAALQGLIDKVFALGLTLIAVDMVEAGLRGDEPRGTDPVP